MTLNLKPNRNLFLHTNNSSLPPTQADVEIVKLSISRVAIGVIFTTAVMFLFSSCDEDSNLPISIEINYDTIASNFATISWGHRPADVTRYEIYFEGDLVYEGMDQNFSFTELVPATTYSGTLICHINGKKLKYDISFRTALSLPPSSPEIIEIRHNSPTEVVVFYEEAIDPEGGPVTYEIHIQNTRLNIEHLLIEGGTGYFKILNLFHSCDHEGRIVSVDEGGKRTEINFTFKTLTPPPVFKGDLYLNSQFEVDIFPYTHIEGGLHICIYFFLLIFNGNIHTSK